MLIAYTLHIEGDTLLGPDQYLRRGYQKDSLKRVAPIPYADFDVFSVTNFLGLPMQLPLKADHQSVC